MLLESLRNGKLNFANFMLYSEVEAVIAECDLLLEDITAEEPSTPPISPGDDPTNPNAARDAKRGMYIDPVTGKNWRAADRWRRLEAVRNAQVAKGVDPNRLWVTFSDVSRLGQRIHINSSKSTPAGIFVFPIDYVIRRKTNTPFSIRPYMHVVMTKEPHYEVGHDKYGGGSDEGLNNIKDALKSIIDTVGTDPNIAKATQALTAVKYKINKYVNKWKGWAQMSGGSKEKKEAADFVTGWVYQIMSKVIDAVRYGHGTVQERLENLDLSELEDDSNDDGAELRAKIAEKMGQVMVWSYDDENLPDFDDDDNDDDFNDEDEEPEPDEDDENKTEHALNESKQIKVFDQINPETLDATYNPQFLAIVMKNPYDWPAKLRTVQPGQFVPIKQIADELNYGDFHYDNYGLGLHKLWDRYDKLRYNKIAAVRTLKKIFKQQLLKTIEELKNQTAPKPEAGPDYSKVPFYDKFKALADKYGLDLNKAIRDSIKGGGDGRGSFKYPNNPRQMVYRMAESLAKQLSDLGGGKSAWQAVWSRLLRELGIKSIADTKDSGYVHSAEATQGTLMDPRDIVHVATIVQQSHASHNDPANRPQAQHWDYDMHRRTLPPQDQRKSDPNIDTSHYTYADKPVADRAAQALTARAEALQNMLGHASASSYGYGYDKRNVDRVLVMLYKIVKTFKKLEAGNPHIYTDNFYSYVSSILTTAKVKNTPIPPERKTTIDAIERLLAGQSDKSRFRRKPKTGPEPPAEMSNEERAIFKQLVGRTFNHYNVSNAAYYASLPSMDSEQARELLERFVQEGWLTKSSYGYSFTPAGMQELQKTEKKPA